MAGDAPEDATAPVVPPRDAEDWTEAQWLAWLEEGADDEAGVRPATAAGRATRSAGGRVLGNAMLGLAEAMGGVQRPTIVVQAEAPGDPYDDGPAVHLDPDDPGRSTVVVRGGRRARRRER